jgi:P27 family predicted phage terminase small subunit
MPNNPGQGRKPKPTHLKLLDGEPNKNRINFDEPKFKPKAPKCPTWLTLEAKREWHRLSPELERLGLLTAADMAMFAAYCSAVGKLEWAEKEMKKMRRLEKRKVKQEGIREIDHPMMGGMISGQKKFNKDGKAVSTGKYNTLPYVWIYNKCLEQLRSFGAEFGLSPSSRTRIKVDDLEDDDYLLTT